MRRVGFLDYGTRRQLGNTADRELLKWGAPVLGDFLDSVRSSVAAEAFLAHRELVDPLACLTAVGLGLVRAYTSCV